jgi:hypothetical protein
VLPIICFFVCLFVRQIVRALALAVAMMVYGKEEGADSLIEQLIRDRDPIVRYGGILYCIYRSIIP